SLLCVHLNPILRCIYCLHLFSLLFFLLIRRPQIPTLFPYTTLFRSGLGSFIGALLGAMLITQVNVVTSFLGVTDARIIPPSRYEDRKSTRLNSSHQIISYAVFCFKKKNNQPLS